MWWWILVIVGIFGLAYYIWRRSEHLTAAQLTPVTVEPTQSASSVEAAWPQSATFTGPAVDLPLQEEQPAQTPTGEDRYTPDAIVDGRLMVYRGDGNLPRPIR